MTAASIRPTPSSARKIGRRHRGITSTSAACRTAKRRRLVWIVAAYFDCFAESVFSSSKAGTGGGRHQKTRRRSRVAAFRGGVCYDPSWLREPQASNPLRRPRADAVASPLVGPVSDRRVLALGVAHIAMIIWGRHVGLFLDCEAAVLRRGFNDCRPCGDLAATVFTNRTQEGRKSERLGR